MKLTSMVRGLGPQHGLDGNFIGGAADGSAVGAHETGGNRSLGLGAAFEQAALDQQPVGALASHAALLARVRSSAADLKFLHHLPRTRTGTSNRKAALEP
jgi:hypothetical protein